MRTKKTIIIIAALAFLIGSCRDYLEPWPNGNYDNENIWQYPNMVQGMINRLYDNIDAYSVGNSRRNYNDNEGSYLDGTTDDAILTSKAHVMSRYATNSMTTSQDPFQTFWDRNYRSISQCNIFLKDRRGYKTRYMVKQVYNDQVRSRLQGEAFALRAYFEWDLLQKFGGKGNNGQMLGFPIVTDVIDPYSEINYERNTYDECVAQIISDCDSAMKYLPLAHRNFLYPSGTDMTFLGGQYWNRFDDTGIWAIKAMLYLTWASPRFNPGNDITRWDSAARYSKMLIDFKINVDQISSGNSFRPAARINWHNPNSPEIVFSTRYITNGTEIERMFYPGNFQGNGEIGPTQELVDAFGMKNGYPIDHPLSLYDPANPYANRDPRFYSAIFHNTAAAKRNNTGATMYTFENWNESNDPAAPGAGKDAAGIRSDNSLTNYHIKKFVYMDVNWADPTVKPGNHSKFLFRWSHFVLGFAEAANHVTHDPNAALYGLTPKDAVRYMRARRTYDDQQLDFRTTDPYVDEVAAAGEAAFDEFVKNERRIETCFEGIRFYDLRRWTTGDLPGEGNWESVINVPLHGAYITRQADGTFVYDLEHEVARRTLPSPNNPIPYYEMLRMSKLVQNEGWPTWN